jgi:hypothetical protein
VEYRKLCFRAGWYSFKSPHEFPIRRAIAIHYEENI